MEIWQIIFYKKVLFGIVYGVKKKLEIIQIFLNFKTKQNILPINKKLYFDNNYSSINYFQFQYLGLLDIYHFLICFYSASSQTFLFFLYILAHLKNVYHSLRSSMTLLRLNDLLAFMYIHGDILKRQQSDIVEDTIKLFCVEPRCLQVLFEDDN